jgi:diacylglycerol kinase (ATP)
VTEELRVDHPFGRPLVIANPVAGRGSGDLLDRLLAVMRDRGLEHDVVVTSRRGQATQLAREAVERDARTYLIAVGGDGTVHEVVNGLVDAGSGQVRGADPVLAVVGNGSGCDLVRTFGLDRPPERLIDHLVTDATLQLDLGRVTLTGPDGQPHTVLFHNVAEVGFGAEVVATAARLPRRLGATRYAVAIVAGWGRFRRVETTVTVDGGERTEALCNVIVANGQFFGGGLRVAPRALPTDGRFNVQTWGGTPTDVLGASRLLRSGRHLARADVREWQSAEVSVHGRRALAVEADGEVLGTAPARFDVLPGVLRFKL